MHKSSKYSGRNVHPKLYSFVRLTNVKLRINPDNFSPMPTNPYNAAIHPNTVDGSTRSQYRGLIYVFRTIPFPSTSNVAGTGTSNESSPFRATKSCPNALNVGRSESGIGKMIPSSRESLFPTSERTGNLSSFFSVVESEVFGSSGEMATRVTPFSWKFSRLSCRVRSSRLQNGHHDPR